MRLLALIFAVWPCFSAITGPHAHTAVQTTSGANITTTAIDTTTGSANLIVIVISGTSNVDVGVGTMSGTCSGSADGNTWSHGTSQRSTTATVAIWYSYNAATCAVHVFNFNQASGNAMGMAVMTFAGVKSSATPFDQQNGANTGSGSASSLASGSITPSENGELIVSGGGMRSSITYTSSPLTVVDSMNWVTGSKVGVVSAAQIQTTATAVNNTLGMAGSGQIANAIASFKAAATASAPIRHRVSQ